LYDYRLGIVNSQYFNNYVFSAKRVGTLSRNVYSSIEVQLPDARTRTQRTVKSRQSLPDKHYKPANNMVSKSVMSGSQMF